MDNERTNSHLGLPGLVALFGSGETSASGRRVYDWLFKQLPRPVRMSILETPAGFQPNSAIVAGKIGEFIHHRLQNYRPYIDIVPARRRGAPFSTNDEKVVSPVLSADVIFLGPGSPTYAVRQLQESIAWHTVVARHRQGATLVLASAATIAIGTQALPVYEIYKAGEDLHWNPGLDMFGPYGLSLVFVSHWNNTEGGAELDTSRCYMGQSRFDQLLNMLPPDINVVGIDEHTALIIETGTESCHVMGRGTVTLLRQGKEERFTSGQSFAIYELGAFHAIEPQNGIPPDIWERVAVAGDRLHDIPGKQPSSKVLALVQSRENAREQGDWKTADDLRKRIATLGWQVNDTRNGPQLTPKDE